jgi:hypothetical protein
MRKGGVLDSAKVLYGHNDGKTGKISGAVMIEIMIEIQLRGR